MLGGLAGVLARAEVRLVWEAKAIDHTLVDQPMAPDIEAACRVMRGIMVQPIRVGV